MTRTRVRILIGVVEVLVIGIIVYVVARPRELVLTGIVTTDDVIVSPLVEGQIGQLLVREGDSVAAGQLVARIVPAELQADRAYYEHSAQDGVVRVQEGQASLRLQEQQTGDQIAQAEAMLAAAVAQQAEATANLQN